MIIKRFSTGPLEVNTYLVCDEESKECIIIDLGGNIDLIKKEADKNGFNLKFILNTHGHFDHIFGEKEAQDKYNLKVFIHKDDEDLGTRVSELTKLWAMPICQAPHFEIFDENSDLKIGSTAIKIIHTPGHTLGGCCFLLEDILFSGDTLFKNATGRTDLEGGSEKSLLDSIKNKLFCLPDETIVLPGHGDETTIKEEKQNLQI